MSQSSVLADLREHEREIRKELILNSAVKLFEEDSFNDFNMRKIADKSGVSAASIYRFFSSKDELLIEILMLEMDNIKKVINDVENRTHLTLEDLVSTTIDYLLEHENFFRMICYFYIDGDTDSKVLKRFFASILSLEPALERVIKKLGITGDVTLRTYSFFSSLSGIVMVFNNYPDITSEERRTLMYEIALENCKRNFLPTNLN